MTDMTTAVLPEHRDHARTLHIFMQVKATRHWLSLSTQERHKFLKEEIVPLLRKRPELTVRYFDAEAFSAKASDVLLWETKDLAAWQWMTDHLRETLYWDHYFEVVEILPALEANFLREVEAAG
jgi:hypothetical protein